MNYESMMKRHLGNISRSVGHDVTDRYSYIITQNELVNAYTQMRDELDYPLMMDSKNRRAIVYNKKGLEKQIQNTVVNSIVDNVHLLDRMVVEDIVSQLNSITQTANGNLIASKGRSKSSNTTSLFVGAMTKGLVNGMGKIIDDMTNINNN